MSVNVLIVEDDPITAMDISEALIDHGFSVTKTVKSGEEALECVKSNKPDVILMDIKLDGELDGVSTAGMIGETERIPIIFITANTDQFTASRAFQTHPAAFISKPFDTKDVIYAIELAFNNHFQHLFENKRPNVDKNGSIFLKTGEKYEKVKLKEILYVQADGSYSKVFTQDKKFCLSTNLNSIWQKISHPDFFRAHRSYIINIDNVTGFDQTYVYFDDQYVPYSKNHKETLMKKLKKLS